MARHGVGFVSESKGDASGKDLLIGVLICSMRCDEWDELSISGKLPKIIASWMRQINACPPWYLRGKYGRILSSSWIGKRWRKRNSFDLLSKIQLFKQYVDAAQSIPKFIRKNEGGGFSVDHWSHNIEVCLRSEVGWTREEIEERPLSNAIADYFKHLENNGLITILTEGDFEQIKNNDAALERAMAEYMAKGGRN